MFTPVTITLLSASCILVLLGILFLIGKLDSFFYFTNFNAEKLKNNYPLKTVRIIKAFSLFIVAGLLLLHCLCNNNILVIASLLVFVLSDIALIFLKKK